MVFILLVITAAAAAAVGYVYSITKQPIEDAKEKFKMEKLASVLPELEYDELKQSKDSTVYIAKQDHFIVGYVFETVSSQGYCGDIKMLVGFDVDGKILNIEVLEQQETPGLGSNMTSPDNVLLNSFKGKKPANMILKVKKDGGDVDALTAATISSVAYTDAVEKAFNKFNQLTK